MERLDGAGVGDATTLLRAQPSNDGRPDPYAPFELTKATVPLATHLLVQTYAETLHQKALSTSVHF